MGKLLTFLFLLIVGIANAQEQPTSLKSLIGTSKLEVKNVMQRNPAYYLHTDTVLLDLGESLWYELSEITDESLLKNRVLNFVFFFKKDKCNGIRFIVFGSDRIIDLMSGLDKHYRRVGVNLWIDDTVNVGIRVIELPVIDAQQQKVNMYRVDIGTIDIFKH